MAAHVGPITLINATLAGAVTGDVTSGEFYINGGRVESLALYCSFVRVGGGTTTKAWVQTTFDGTNWMDIANFAFTTTTALRAYHLSDVSVTSITTPTDGTLADNTAVDGFLGPRLRVKLTTTGTYTGASSITITAHPA